MRSISHPPPHFITGIEDQQLAQALQEENTGTRKIVHVRLTSPQVQKTFTQPDSDQHFSQKSDPRKKDSTNFARPGCFHRAIKCRSLSQTSVQANASIAEQRQTKVHAHQVERVVFRTRANLHYI